MYVWHRDTGVEIRLIKSFVGKLCVTEREREKKRERERESEERDKRLHDSV